MDQQKITFWQIILQIGSISGLFTLFYTATQNLKKKPKFKFDFRSSSGASFNKDNLEYYKVTFDGYVKNQSIEPNSITNICYAIWVNKTRTKTLTYGGQPSSIILDPTSNKKLITLPISFKPNESKHLLIEFEVVLTGSHEKALVEAVEKVSDVYNLYLPKYNRYLTFKDVNENLFDDQGKIRSQKLIDLWWTLPNTFNKLKNGNPLPYIWHMMKIIQCYFLFKLRRLVAHIGF